MFIQNSHSLSSSHPFLLFFQEKKYFVFFCTKNKRNICNLVSVSTHKFYIPTLTHLPYKSLVIHIIHLLLFQEKIKHTLFTNLFSYRNHDISITIIIFSSHTICTTTTLSFSSFAVYLHLLYPQRYDSTENNPRNDGHTFFVTFIVILFSIPRYFWNVFSLLFYSILLLFLPIMSEI